jgi:hypothetical protein
MGLVKIRVVPRMLSFLCLIAALILPVGASAETPSHLDVQLIADRKKAGAGGSVSYHLIYHNGSNLIQSDVKFIIKVPDGMEPIDPIQGQWNATLQILQWNVMEVPLKGANVIHFKLKIKSDVKSGTPLDLSGTVQAGAEVSIQLPPVRVIAGTQIDQPFYNGYPDGKFHPEYNMTRAETAAVVARIQNLELNRGSTVSYSDVDTSHWAHSYILKVTQAGYMEGDGARFRPEDPITRAELVTLVLRMRGVHEIPLIAFEDMTEHWAKHIVSTAKGLRFVEGLADGTFQPDMAIRRDAAAKLINIGLSRGPLENGVINVVQHFPDVSASDWSFGWVEEASMVAHEAEVNELGQERLIRYLPEQTEPF